MELRKYYTLENSLYILVASLILGLASWYQISPLTYNQYKFICAINYGNSSEFTRCMSPYWSQYNLDYLVTLICVGLALLAVISCVYLLLKRR